MSSFPPLAAKLRNSPAIVFLLWSLVISFPSAQGEEAVRLPASPSVSLDGTWLLAIDPKNVGRDERWFEAPRGDAQTVKVPWIIQDAFPAYHGAAWFWRDFIPQPNANKDGRFLLRFTSVEFSGEVWVNNQFVGKHEGAEAPFAFDVTDQLKPGQVNRLAVRVMNPDNSPTDGLGLAQTPRGARVVPYRSGGSYNAGGITGSVHLLTVPAVRLDDLYVIPDPKSGVIRIEAEVFNATDAEVPVKVEFGAGPASAGETLVTGGLEQKILPGKSCLKTELKIAQPKLWDLNDPNLYRVTAHLDAPAAKSLSEVSVRCGFRDFRIEDGYFHLNGRRIFLRSTHTTGGFPIGQSRPHDRDLARRDIINLKTMGFNMVRFIWGGAEQYVLDLCDEIGLMVYQETLASQPIEPSPRMGELFDASVAGVIRRDRNHPSIVLWGLLNEAQFPKHEPAFRHAVGMLPLIRSLDGTRLVVLNSGRFDGFTPEKMDPKARVEMWRHADRETPWVACSSDTAQQPAPAAAQKDFNPTNPGGNSQTTVSQASPNRIVLEPGAQESSVVRWIAPHPGRAEIIARFKALPPSASNVVVRVLQNGKSLYEKKLSAAGYPSGSFSGHATVAKGDTMDFAVGSQGGEKTGAANTVLTVVIAMEGGETYDAIRDYSRTRNPSGPWSYGSLSSTASSEFSLYADRGKNGVIGGVSNPGSSEWETLIVDDHTYPRVPHTADVIDMFRKKRGYTPVFLSEYGIGSAVDLWRVVRQFERHGKLESEEGQYYAERLNRYLDDWEKWRLNELYARPEDFFMESLRKMAGQRTLGINAIRANPNIIGYSLTSGIGDPVNCGEGLTTVFRELKPGAIDAVHEALGPLRWCLFVEPVNLYRGGKVRLEAVLANEDALPPGDYPALFQVVGPANERIFEKKISIRVPENQNGAPPPFAIPVFGEELAINGPAGTYRFLATLERGGAPTGGDVRFFVDDPKDMPKVSAEVVFWGQDPPLEKWLREHGIKVRPFSDTPMRSREIIIAGARPPEGGVPAFRELAARMAQGATVIFLAPEVLQREGNVVGWLPLANKGNFAEIKSWLYLKDEWAKRHPIFEGLPAGGLMDPVFYREIIPDTAWSGQDPPAEAVAGAIKASEDYSSGLMVAVYPFGAGRFILSNLLIRENLGTHPVAERLLRNLILYAARNEGKPPAALPADFAAQLQAIGYR